MINSSMPRLKIGNLEVALPIIQGGMGVGISMSQLASSVANQGGVGVIASVGLDFFDHAAGLQMDNCTALRVEIRKAREKSNGIVGVNIMVALTDFDQLVKVALEEEVDLLFLGAGMPLKAPRTVSFDFLRSIKTKIVPIVSSARTVKLIFSSWEKKFGRIPDAVVVEGPLAGGHLGFSKEQILDPYYSLENLVPEVKAALAPFCENYSKHVPVIAAGGILNGEDIYKFISLGADAVQMGSRFVATQECDASQAFKSAYLSCAAEDIVIIDSPVGLPGRAIRSPFLEKVQQGSQGSTNCLWKCLKRCNMKKAAYCIAKALMYAQRGCLEKGFAFAGAQAYKIKEILSVKELFRKLVTEYEAAATC